MKTKRNLWILAAMAMIISVFAFIPASEEVLEIGASAPKAEVKMKDVSGKMYSLKDLKKENGLLVIFSCNTCPFVVGTGGKEGWERRYNGIYELASSSKAGMVLINSNEAYRGDQDSFDEMVKHSEKLGYKSPYVVDKNHVLADAFGAKTTPHVFLFDKDMKLVYKGAIDDNNASASDVKEHYLNDALNDLAEGQKIEPNSTKSLGCSIKRVKA